MSDRDINNRTRHDEHAVLGRVLEVRLPERERLVVEPRADTGVDAVNPLGVIQLLASIGLATGATTNGMPSYPRIGQHVFSAHPLIIKYAVEAGALAADRNIHLATLPQEASTIVSFSPEVLLGRHCAVLGTTGGGKSWTVARIVEEIARLKGKAILFDPTGEYYKFSGWVRHVYLGGKKKPKDTREFVSFPYRELSELDLFVLFQPSAGSQAPKLREAIRSLKLAKLEPTLAPGGFLIKNGNPRAPIEAGFAKHAVAISAHAAEYDISQLSRQVNEECIWPTGKAPSYSHLFSGPRASGERA